MDVYLCPFCGGELHGGYVTRPPGLVFSMRCPYCGHAESYVVATERFSLVASD
jgi:DNA-directed RNA polymerase subunit RPC12/RpoP